MAELIDIFADVKSMTPTINYISSIGGYIDPQDRQVAEEQCMRIIAYLPEKSLAYKIAKEGNPLKFTDKQRWVIAYELQKNPKYIKWLDEFLKEVAWNVERKRAKNAAKRNTKREFKKKLAETASANAKYTQGSKVEHPTFGKGTVVSNDGNIIKVKFGKETKDLSVKFTRFKN